MSRVDLTFLIVLAVLAIDFVFDIGLISVIRDILKRKDSE